LKIKVLHSDLDAQFFLLHLKDEFRKFFEKCNNSVHDQLQKLGQKRTYIQKNTIENLDQTKIDTMDKLKTTIKRWILLGQINEPTTDD